MTCVRRLGYREGLFFFVDCDGEPLYFFRLGQLLELLRVRGCRRGWRCDRPGEYVVEVEGAEKDARKAFMRRGTCCYGFSNMRVLLIQPSMAPNMPDRLAHSQASQGWA